MATLARLNPYFRRYARLFVPGLACAVVSAVFSVLVPIVVRRAVDSIPGFIEAYRRSGADAAVYNDVLWRLAALAGTVIGLSVLSGAFLFIMRQTIVVASRHFEFDLREALYAALQRLPPAFYRALSTGDVITRSTSDVEQVRRYMGPAIMYAARAVTLVVLAIVVMMLSSPVLTGWALLPMPLLAVAVFFVARLEYARSDAIQTQYSVLTSRVQEAFAGIRVVKAYTREGAEAEAFAVEARRLQEKNLALGRVDAAWVPVFVILVGMSTILVVWQGGRLVAAGTVSVGNIAEFIIYVALMTWPVASMGYVISMIQRAAASLRRLEVILDAVPEIRDTDATDATITAVEGALAFEDVHFRHPSSPGDVLSGVSFALPPGGSLGVVGRTGSGKTTLVSLVPRLVDPTGGRVLIDGRDARELPVEVLRRAIGYVPQDVFLFSDTVGGNIAFGNRDASPEMIERAAEEADLLENVRAFPDGFETVVGERGITLSGGQKQRTAIARALLREPRILVFDDALSAVDTQTERRILANLRARAGRQTLVVVSHRVSAVQDSDLILVLDEGRVAERGSHADLVAHGGLYADLYRKQLLEEELAEAA